MGTRCVDTVREHRRAKAASHKVCRERCDVVFAVSWRFKSRRRKLPDGHSGISESA